MSACMLHCTALLWEEKVMKVIVFAALLCCVSSQQFQVNDSIVQPSTARVSYPPGDVRNCAQNQGSGVLPPRVLETLPGLGFDNLRNFDSDRVFSVKYSTCKTTADGRYLIPDEYFIIPQHGTELKFFSEYFQNWYDYSSFTSSSINVGGSLIGFNLFSIGGSYSEENRRVKTQQVQQNSVTTRTQLRRAVYTVKLGSSVPLHPEFRKRVYEIAANIASNQENLAHYCAELLVRDFGTHYLTSIDVGGVFAKNDYISRDYAELREVKEKNITSAAAFNFPGLSLFNGSIDFGFADGSQNSERSREGYRQNLVASDILTFGGPPITEQISISEWQNGIQDNLAIIDRSGDPLSFAITPTNFPEIDGIVLRNISSIIQDTTDRYFKDNNIAGCADMTNSNFNYQANNPNAEACANGSDSSYLDRAFGGIFQNCSSYGREPLCNTIQQTNPLTGGYSCPRGYQAVLLNRGTDSVTRQYSRTEEDCFLFFCSDETYYFHASTTATYETYWCSGIGESQENRGYLFGGYYSLMMNNPFTASRSCPTYYQPRQFGRNVQLCTSSDYELGGSQAIRFGGFFSCLVGNPLVNPEGRSNTSVWTRTCPMGYTQHLITIENNCEISICLEMGSYGGRERLVLPKLPPYRSPLFNPNGTEPITILGSQNTVLIKNTQGEWTTYNITDPRAFEILQSATQPPGSTTSSQTSQSSPPSSSSSNSSSNSSVMSVAIAALVFGIVAVVAIAITIVVVSIKARKWNE